MEARYRVTDSSRGTRRWITPALFAAVFVFHLWALMRFPAPFVDEAWNASRAWAFLQTGHPFGPLDSGILDRFDGYWTLFPWLPTFVQSLSLHFSSEPSLLGIRLVSLTFGMMLLVALYTIGRRLGGESLGLGTVCLTAVSWPFLYSAHMGRPDVFASAFGFAAVALHLNNRRRRLWISLLSGLTVGIGIEMHPNAVIYVPVILAMFFLDEGWFALRQRYFWGFAAGAGSGVVLYVVLHVLRHPELYALLGRLGLGAGYVPPVATLDARELGRAFGQLGALLVVLYNLFLVVIVWAVAFLTRRRTEADKALLVLGLGLVLTFALTIQRKSGYYTIFYTPAVDMMSVAFLLSILREPWRATAAGYFRRVLPWGALVGFVALNLLPLKANEGQAYNAVQDRIAEAVRPGESIMGSQTYWFGLHDHVYYSWEQLIYFQHYAPGSNLEDALTEFRPDIFIIDRHLNGFISDRTDDSPRPYLWLPKSELMAFLNRRANLIDEFDDITYGPIRVYRIDW